MDTSQQPRDENKITHKNSLFLSWCILLALCFAFVSAAPAAAVIAEAEVAFVLADAYLRKFGCDNMTDIKAALKAYRQRLRTASR